MERTLKRLLRMYPVVRNWMALPNYMAPLHSVQNVLQMYSTNLPDHTQLEGVTKSLKERNIYSNVKVVQEPMEILEMAVRNYRNMSVNDAVKTMTTLFRASKGMKNLHNVENHPGFTYLCEILSRNVRHMKIPMVIESLKILTYFQIQSNSLLVQSLLQMIRTNINEISLHDIIFLCFLLNKMGSTPLRDALLIALPLVFEIQLPTKLDVDDIFMLTRSLRFLHDYNIQNPDIHDLILNSLWKSEHIFDIQTSKLIFYDLCSISQLSPVGSKMLSKVQNVFISMAKELNVEDIVKILGKLSTRETFYNETFVDALVNSALSSDIGYALGIHVLTALNDLNHVHIPFLEYLAAKCFENPTVLKDATYNEISVLLQGFINADYKPLFWDTIKEAIMENIEADNKSYIKTKKLLIRCAVYLTALDCYNPNLISKVFSIFIKTDEPLRNIYVKEILLLYQSIKSIYPMYDGPWPQDLLEYANIIKLIPPVYSLKPGLERALGGSQYVYNDLKTKFEQHIDHVVVMRKGGYPIAINTDINNSGITYIEDLRIPNESQMILIFNLPDHAYAINSQRLKSIWTLKIKAVEALTKCNTVGINSSSWMKLPEHERIPYLMQAIKLKCQDLLVSTN